MSSSIKPRRWYQIKWFQDYDTAEERKLIVKLDLLIVPYVFLVSVPQMIAISSTLTRHLQAYWVKYIDQANISMYDPDPSGILSIDLP